MARLLYWFNKHILTPISRSIRMKLLLIMLFVAIGPLLLATVISYANTKRAIEREVLSQNRAKMDWVQTSIHNDLNRINESLTAFYFDSDITFYLNKIDADSSLRTLSAAFYQNKIKSYLMANYQDFALVSFYIIDYLKAYHYSMESGLTTEVLPPDFQASNPLFQASSNLVIDQPALGQYELNVRNSGPYMIKYYRRFDDRRVMGVLVARLKWKMFDNAIQLLSLEKGSQIYFTRGDGSLIYGQYSTWQTPVQMTTLLTAAQATPAGQTTRLDDQYVFMRQVYDDIYLIKTIPIQVVRQAYLMTLNYQLVLIVLTVALVIILTLLLGLWITRPITTLARSMHEVETYLDRNDQIYTPQVRTNDEIRILEQSYSMMLERIKVLIDQEYKQKIETQSAQLMALQAQINPHFMYNTLQMIGAMAVENGTPEIYQIIAAFSNMMRYNMRLSEDLVTIKQELASLDYYLAIQRQRFAEGLEVQYDIDKAALTGRLPRLTIQPIVENCFKHGFSHRSRPWQIWIRLTALEAQICIEIADNGSGIPDARLAAIEQSLADSTRIIPNSADHLGLKNIDARLKLACGPDSGLTIANRPGGGTSVTVILAHGTARRGEP